MKKKTIIDIVFFLGLVPLILFAIELLFYKDVSFLRIISSFLCFYLILMFYKYNRQIGSKIKPNYWVKMQDGTGDEVLGEVVKVVYDQNMGINVVFVRTQSGEIHCQREEMVKITNIGL